MLASTLARILNQNRPDLGFPQSIHIQTITGSGLDLQPLTAAAILTAVRKTIVSGGDAAEVFQATEHARMALRLR